ncbi:hypothetical protein WN55_04782 [Dufourea novaeangliae]|uniref:Uncharacterized protein n=1 Tax=Dufourea novaeangliae TaxID=178035 RepID=A0A154P1Y9_DUFNO|nr:hypothetical protein WN55_04782 [Dufourea novaeangliae]
MPNVAAHMHGPRDGHVLRRGERCASREPHRAAGNRVNRGYDCLESGLQADRSGKICFEMKIRILNYFVVFVFQTK